MDLEQVAIATVQVAVVVLPENQKEMTVQVMALLAAVAALDWERDYCPAVAAVAAAMPQTDLRRWVAVAAADQAHQTSCSQLAAVLILQTGLKQAAAAAAVVVALTIQIAPSLTAGLN